MSIHISNLERDYLQKYDLTIDEWREVTQALAPYLSERNYSLILTLAHNSIQPNGNKIQERIKKLMDVLLKMQMAYDLNLQVVADREDIQILEYLREELFKIKEG